jgi:superfamily II DNA or RNA helicase
MADYSYQEKISKEIISNLNKGFDAIVLAACPGSGKGVMIQKIINSLPRRKVLIITHGQKLLKAQFLKDLKSPKTPINFTFGEIGSGSDVEVGIMQEYSKITSKYDIVVIDEAHHFYGSESSNTLLSKSSPQDIILLTGTPSKLGKMSNNFKFVFVSAEDISKNDVYSTVNIDFIKTGSNDISHEIMAIKSKISKFKNQKIMIMAPSVKYAESLRSSLSNRKVGVSTSSDSKNKVIESYLNGEIDTLIVVNKGILGFNDPSTTMVIDLKASDNVDLTYQFLARALRKGNVQEKHYLRLVNKNNWNENVSIMKKVANLFTSKGFKQSVKG